MWPYSLLLVLLLLTISQKTILYYCVDQLTQGEKMNNQPDPEIFFANSVLSVKSSGIDVSNDLNLPEGKTIAELLYDQQENNKK
jgi:hypothetical protein